MNKKVYARKEMIIAIIIITLMFIVVSMLKNSDQENFIFSVTVLTVIVSIKVIATLISYKNNTANKSYLLQKVVAFLQHLWFDIVLTGIGVVIITIRLVAYKDVMSAVFLAVPLLFMMIKAIRAYRKEKING